MSPNLEFDHIGLACRDLDGEERHLALLGYKRDGTTFEDPEQGITGRFLVGPGPRLELLAQLPGSSVLDAWLRDGPRYYHQAFRVELMETAMAEFEGGGARVVRAPVPSVAFSGARIAFLMLPGLHLIELIENLATR